MSRHMQLAPCHAKRCWALFGANSMAAKGFRFAAWVAVGALCMGTAAHAQTASSPANGPAAETAPAGEHVLPPVVVRPEDRSPVQGDDRGGPVASPGGELGERSAAYPNLGEQLFGQGELTGLDSITRGERSIFDLPAAGMIVDRQTIREKQPTDMARALENEVGVMVQQTARGQASPFIRGLTGQQVLILVDGIRMNNSVYRIGANQYFNLIDPGQVERISYPPCSWNSLASQAPRPPQPIHPNLILRPEI